jgi:hypothetical protein
MEVGSTKLPAYRLPPVTEVVCGVTFKPLKGLLAPHVGLLWNTFRSEYPEAKEVEPLLPVIESFGDNSSPFIFEQLGRNADHWFFALRAITGINPIPEEDRGRIPEMCKHWLQWGEDHGFVR